MIDRGYWRSSRPAGEEPDGIGTHAPHHRRRSTGSCGPAGRCERCHLADRRRGAGLGHLRAALRLRHRHHLRGPAADHEGVRHRRRGQAGHRGQHPARGGDRRAHLQPALRAARPAGDASAGRRPVRDRCAVVLAGARSGAALGRAAGARLRGRRCHPDRADVRRRALAAALPRPARVVLPDRHRGRHRDRHRGRGQRDHRLRVAVGSAAALAAVMLACMLRLPESPRWLVKADRRDEAHECSPGCGPTATTSTPRSAR